MSLVAVVMLVVGTSRWVTVQRPPSTAARVSARAGAADTHAAAADTDCYCVPEFAKAFGPETQ